MIVTMESVLNFILIFSAIGMAISYLYFIQYIRKYSNKHGFAYDNFFILNLYKVYKKYIEIRKYNNKKPWFLLSLHFIFITVTLILGYFLEGK